MPNSFPVSRQENKEIYSPVGKTYARVALLTGCVQRVISPNADFAFDFEPTAAVIGYVDGAKYVSSLATHGSNIICLVSGMSQLGVAENSNSEFNVYPNPTNGKFNITLPSNIKANVSVVDAEGKVILEKNNLSNGALMNLGNVAPGVYLVNISSENEVQTIRIVKN